MSQIRYTAVAAGLKSRIIRRELVRKLPSERFLAEELCCSRRTVREALALLEAENLVKILPSSGGRAVPPRRKAVRRIGIVSTQEPDRLRKEPGIAELAGEMLPDGFGLEVLQVRERFFAPGAEQLGCGFAGLMFVFSTLTVEIAEELTGRGIPFVSGNRLPMLKDLHFVEWDNGGALREMTAALVRRGYRKIGLFFPGALENYAELSQELWRGIKKEFALAPLAVDRFRVDWTLPNEVKLRRLRSFMRETGEAPEAMIFWQGIPDDFQAVPGMLHCYAASPEEWTARPDGAAYEPDRGFRLYRELYAAMREVIWFPPERPIRRFVPMRVKFLQEIPPVGNLRRNRR